MWGKGRAYIAQLNSDCLSFQTESVFSWRPGNYREALWIYKRNGLYYASWSENDAREAEYCVKYAMSESLYGPWSAPRILVEQGKARKIYGTGHHSIIRIPHADEWVIAYHRFAFSSHGLSCGGDGFHRETVFAPLQYEADGRLRQVDIQAGSY